MRPLALGILVGLGGCGGGPDALCESACPDGTNAVQVDFEGVIVEGTLVFETDACTATCEPIFQCVFPNLPKVTDAGYACEAIDGYATIPAQSDVDTGFGDLWGELAPPVTTPLGQQWSAIDWADVDGDGLGDVVLLDGGQVHVFFGLGDGSFEAPVRSGTQLFAQDLVLGEFTGDGRIDVAVVDPSPSRGVSVLAGDGLGTFAAPLPGLADFGTALQVADVDGDGRDDLLTTTDGGRVAFADPGGTFTPWALNGPWGAQQAEIRALDTTGDGRLEIAYAAAGGTVFANQGGRTFGPAVTGIDGTQDLVNLEVGDVDGDGSEDLLVWNPAYGTLDAYGFDGASVTAKERFDGATDFAWRRGDADGDGALDGVNDEGVFWMSGFGAPYLLSRQVSPSSGSALIDIDGDGLAEGVFANVADGTLTVVWP